MINHHNVSISITQLSVLILSTLLMVAESFAGDAAPIPVSYKTVFLSSPSPATVSQPNGTIAGSSP